MYFWKQKLILHLILVFDDLCSFIFFVDKKNPSISNGRPTKNVKSHSSIIY